MLLTPILRMKKDIKPGVATHGVMRTTLIAVHLVDTINE
jgi:hypothetical protein